VAFSPDGSTLASGHWQRVLLWKSNSCSPVRELVNDLAQNQVLALSADGTFVAAGYMDSKWIAIWDSRSDYARGLEGDEINVAALLFSPGGEWLAGGACDGQVRIWDLATCKVPHELTAPNFDPVTCLAVSSDGKWRATGGNYGSLCLWNTATWEQVAWLPCRYSVLGIWFRLESDPLETRVADAGGVTGVPNVYVLELVGK